MSSYMLLAENQLGWDDSCFSRQILLILCIIKWFLFSGPWLIIILETKAAFRLFETALFLNSRLENLSI